MSTYEPMSAIDAAVRLLSGDVTSLGINQAMSRIGVFDSRVGSGSSTRAGPPAAVYLRQVRMDGASGKFGAGRPGHPFVAPALESPRYTRPSGRYAEGRVARVGPDGVRAGEPISRSVWRSVGRPVGRSGAQGFRGRG